MKIGITGGTGGLGIKLVQKLQEKGHEIVLLVRKSSNISYFQGLKNISYIIGDMQEVESLRKFVKDLDVCYHIAAQVNHTTKENYFRINVEGTRRLCNVLLKHNPGCHLIYCSSIVVGDVNIFSKHILSDYTMSKYEAEKVIDSYMEKNQLNITVVYPGYIYGGNDKNFLPNIINMVQSGLKFMVHGGERNVPVIYVDDLCNLFSMCGENPCTIGKKYSSIEEQEQGMHDFIRIVARMLHCSEPKYIYPKSIMILLSKWNHIQAKLFHGKENPMLSMRIINALSKRGCLFTKELNHELGWKQEISLEEGISRAFHDYEKAGGK